MSISSLSQRFSNYFFGSVDRYLFAEKLKSDSQFRDQFSSFQNKIIEIVMTAQKSSANKTDAVYKFIDDIISNRGEDVTNENPHYKALYANILLKEKIQDLFPDRKNIHRINAQELKERLKIQIEAFSISRNFSYFSSKLNENYKNKFYTRLQNLIKDPTKNYELSKIDITVTKFLDQKKIAHFNLQNQPLIDTSDRDEMLFQDLLGLDLNEIFPSSISQENFEYRKNDLISCISTPKFIKEIVEWKKTTLIKSIQSKIEELKHEGSFNFNQIKNTLEHFFQNQEEQKNKDNINGKFLDDLKKNSKNDLEQILKHSAPNFKEMSSTYFILEILTPDHKELPKQKTNFLDQIKTEVKKRLNQHNCDPVKLKNALRHFFADMNSTGNNNELPKDFDHPFYNSLLQYQQEAFKKINMNSLDDINTIATELSAKALEYVDIEIKENKEKLIGALKSKIEICNNFKRLKSIQSALNQCIDRYKLELDPSYQKSYHDTSINDETKVETDSVPVNELFDKYFNFALSENDLDEIKTKITILVEEKSKKIIEKPLLDLKERICQASTFDDLEIIQNSFHRFIDRYKLISDLKNKDAEDSYDTKYINDETKVTTDSNLLKTLIYAYSDISLSVPDLEKIKLEIKTFIEEKIQEGKNDKKAKILEFEGNFFHVVNTEITTYCSREISADILQATLNKFFEMGQISNQPNRTKIDDDHLLEDMSEDPSINKELLLNLYKKHLKTLSLILRQKKSTEETKFYQETFLKLHKLNDEHIQKIEKHTYKKILEIIYKFKKLEPSQKEHFWSTIQMLSKKYSKLDPEAIWNFIDYIFSIPDVKKRQYWLERVEKTEIDENGYAIKTAEDTTYLTELKEIVKNLKKTDDNLFKTEQGIILLNFLNQKEMSSEFGKILLTSIQRYENDHNGIYGYRNLCALKENSHLEQDYFSAQSLYLSDGKYDTRSPIPEIMYKLLSYKERGLLEETRGIVWATISLIFYHISASSAPNEQLMKFKKYSSELRLNISFWNASLQFVLARRRMNSEKQPTEADIQMILELFSYQNDHNNYF